jgi:hypothetical protein
VPHFDHGTPLNGRVAEILQPTLAIIAPPPHPFLSQGDCILALNGENVAGNKIESLTQHLEKAGETIELLLMCADRTAAYKAFSLRDFLTTSSVNDDALDAVKMDVQSGMRQHKAALPDHATAVAADTKGSSAGKQVRGGQTMASRRMSVSNDKTMAELKRPRIINVTRGEGGFGFNMIDISTENVKEIFVSHVTPDGPADTEGGLRPGMQVRGAKATRTWLGHGNNHLSSYL